MNTSTPDRIRVAALQYFIRPVRTFDDFQDQVVGLVETASDYKCQLVVFPEYFTVQLLTLGDTKRPIREQVRALAGQTGRYVDLFRGLAQRLGLYIVAGSIPAVGEDQCVRNVSYVFSPAGEHGVQPKLHMTRFETEEWKISAGNTLRLFETSFGLIAVAICYDVEFPEIAREAARRGAHILVVPSCTDERQGFLRVRYCGQARAIENQMYVVNACTVGSLPMVPAVSLNYGQASILTPSDFAFSRDGILAEGNANQEMMVIGELNLRTIAESRSAGTVLPLNDSSGTAAALGTIEVVKL
jgi:predicted amidohydrolase